MAWHGAATARHLGTATRTVLSSVSNRQSIIHSHGPWPMLHTARGNADGLALAAVFASSGRLCGRPQSSDFWVQTKKKSETSSEGAQKEIACVSVSLKALPCKYGRRSSPHKDQGSRPNPEPFTSWPNTKPHLEHVQYLDKMNPKQVLRSWAFCSMRRGDVTCT